MVLNKRHWIFLTLMAVGAAIFLVIGIFIGKIIHWPHKNSPPTSNGTNTSEADWLQKFSAQTQKIIQHMTTGDGKGIGYTWLGNITDTFGPRLMGTEALENAIDFTIQNLKNQALFDNVHTETVPISNYWIRGVETAKLLQPRNHTMSIVGFGRTVPTPSEGITAQAIVFRSFAEMDRMGRETPKKLEGKIFIFNEPWMGSYGKTVGYRYASSRAAALGAVAVLVRSVTPFSVYSPHTGITSYANSSLKIPAAALTVEDAEMLWRMQERGQKLTVYLKITSGYVNKSASIRNTIFQLTGTEKPNEIVLLSGHFDSWDISDGAMDDGSGCAVMWQALTTLKTLGYMPKRTIRVIFWTGEEFGYKGSRHYYNIHKNWTNETFIVVSESDEGAFKPTSLNATMEFFGTPNDTIRMQEISGQIQKNGIPISVSTVSPWEIGELICWTGYERIPGFFYVNHDKTDYYFTFHHSRADSMTVLKPEDVDYTGAVFASFANILANMEQPLQPVPKR